MNKVLAVVALILVASISGGGVNGGLLDPVIGIINNLAPGLNALLNSVPELVKGALNIVIGAVNSLTGTLKSLANGGGNYSNENQSADVVDRFCSQLEPIAKRIGLIQSINDINADYILRLIVTALLPFRFVLEGYSRYGFNVLDSIPDNLTASINALVAAAKARDMDGIRSANIDVARLLSLYSDSTAILSTLLSRHCKSTTYADEAVELAASLYTALVATSSIIYTFLLTIYILVTKDVYLVSLTSNTITVSQTLEACNSIVAALELTVTVHSKQVTVMTGCLTANFASYDEFFTNYETKFLQLIDDVGEVSIETLPRFVAVTGDPVTEVGSIFAQNLDFATLEAQAIVQANKVAANISYYVESIIG